MNLLDPIFLWNVVLRFSPVNSPRSHSTHKYVEHNVFYMQVLQIPCTILYINFYYTMWPYPCDFRPLINSYQGGLQQPDNILICCGYQYTLLMRESLDTRIIICVATILMPYPYQGDSPRWYEDFCVVQKYECEWYENNIFIIIIKNTLCVCMCVYMCVCVIPTNIVVLIEWMYLNFISFEEEVTTATTTCKNHGLGRTDFLHYFV